MLKKTIILSSCLIFLVCCGERGQKAASESQILLKDVAGASKRYEAVHGGTQASLEQLEAEAYIKLDQVLKDKWKIDISGDIFFATSTDEMEGGAGRELRYNRRDGTFSGYGVK